MKTVADRHRPSGGNCNFRYRERKFHRNWWR